MTRHFLASILLFATAQVAWGQIGITSTTFNYAQNFDTLPASGSAEFAQFDAGTPTIDGVFAVRTGTGTTIVASDANTTAGNLYSFGTGTSTERAFGTIGSGGMAAGSFAFGFVFRNDTATALNASVAYTGEQWRYSGTAEAQTMAFSYLVQSTTPTTTEIRAALVSLGTIPRDGSALPGYTRVSALDFVSPVISGTTGALDGNNPLNQVNFNPTFIEINLNPGQYVIFVFDDPNHPGNDHALAVDNFQVTFAPVPEPATVLGLASLGLGAAGFVRRRLLA